VVIYYYNDQITEEEMCRTCDTYGKKLNVRGFLVGKLAGKREV
jgi:hypothetical protein